MALVCWNNQLHFYFTYCLFLFSSSSPTLNSFFSFFSFTYLFCWRFRIVDETFVDTTPTGPDGGSEESDVSDVEAKKVPYTLIVSWREF